MEGARSLSWLQLSETNCGIQVLLTENNETQTQYRVLVAQLLGEAVRKCSRQQEHNHHFDSHSHLHHEISHLYREIRCFDDLLMQ